jgi:hypothetical protein
MVAQQVVRKDPDLNTDVWDTRFAEVRDELFADLRSFTDRKLTTNRHRGIVNALIPKRGFEYALRWRENYTDFLP